MPRGVSLQVRRHALGHIFPAVWRMLGWQDDFLPHLFSLYPVQRVNCISSVSVNRVNELNIIIL
jgi:hypothetical protein